MPAAVLVLLLTYFLVALQRLPKSRIKAPAGALLGAVLMVSLGVVSAADAISYIPASLLLFLTGMLVIAEYLQAGNVISFFAERVLRYAGNPRRLLIAVLVLSAVFSALALNLTAAIVISPLVIAICRKVGIPPAPYLVAVILGANLGGAATAVGSPQTMLVVSLAGIGFLEYAAKMAEICLAGAVVASIWLYMHFRVKLPSISFGPALADIVPQRLNFTGWSSIIVLICVIAALMAGVSMPVAAIGGAALLLAVNPQPPKDVLSCVNWPLIATIGALFVVVGGAVHSGIALWAATNLIPEIENEIAHIAAVVAAGGFMSFVFSDVSSAAFFQAVLSEMENPKILWFALALTTSFAGNLSLYGSLSNLTVVETSRERGEQIGYLEFLKVGLPVSLVTLAIGIAFLSFR
ncbi:MAG: hypothetical protein HRF49_03410 [bacterium]